MSVRSRAKRLVERAETYGFGALYADREEQQLYDLLTPNEAESLLVVLETAEEQGAHALTTEQVAEFHGILHRWDAQAQEKLGKSIESLLKQFKDALE